MIKDLPHDFPFPNRPHRFYIALTNHCNRHCPWCSTYSSPQKNTWLSLEILKQTLSPFQSDIFEAQLEGGEPTLHPEFWSIVHFLKKLPTLSRLILCTNGVILPRKRQNLVRWVKRLGPNLTIKLSFNHHLLETTDDLLDFAKMLCEVIQTLGGERRFILNVRRRKGVSNDDEKVLSLITEAGLLPYSNVFFLQRYGLASYQQTWEEPFLVANHFTFINPDGRLLEPNLIERSKAMEVLP